MPSCVLCEVDLISAPGLYVTSTADTSQLARQTCDSSQVAVPTISYHFVDPATASGHRATCQERNSVQICNGATLMSIKLLWESDWTEKIGRVADIDVERV